MQELELRLKALKLGPHAALYDEETNWGEPGAVRETLRRADSRLDSLDAFCREIEEKAPHLKSDPHVANVFAERKELSDLAGVVRLYLTMA